MERDERLVERDVVRTSLGEVEEERVEGLSRGEDKGLLVMSRSTEDNDVLFNRTLADKHDSTVLGLLLLLLLLLLLPLLSKEQDEEDKDETGVDGTPLVPD